MENRFRNLFLDIITVASLMLSTSVPAAGQQEASGSILIQPDIPRISFEEARIDSNNFEIMLNAGYLSIEDFGVQPVLAAKLNYYVNEDIFVQFSLARATAGKTSYEILSGGAPLLTDEERKLQYTTIDVGYNLLPGEAFINNETAFNTSFYLSGGIGNTTFAGSDRFTINYGAGYRLLLNDAFSITLDFRNIVFDMDVFGRNRATNNLQLLIGAGWFF